MKVLVAVKRVVDYNVKVRAKADGSDVELNNVKMAINPFCEIAVEEAVRLKEAGTATEVVVASIGDKSCQEQIRTALALGADRGIHVEVDGRPEPLEIAKLLKGVVSSESPDLVIMGKQSIDGDNNQTGQMLAAMTGMGQGTFASEVNVAEGSVQVIHGLGWPLSESGSSGGAFMYHAENNEVYLGLITDLNYSNPHVSPFEEFQRWKTHPKTAPYLEGAERLAYGARALAKGGLNSLPKMHFPGGLIIGCDAGTLNAVKIKGNHTAMKSGMLAAEEVAAALMSETPGVDLAGFDTRVANSWLGKELRSSRNFAGYMHTFGALLGSAAVWFDQTIMRGNMPFTLRDRKPDHACLQPASVSKKIAYPKPDNVITFDKLSSVFLSNTNHEEDQPCHLQLVDSSIPIQINLPKYDEPAQRYCPAGVYEVITDGDEPRFQINAQNCVHCKTCDIKDPSQNIRWVTPEGLGGPNYPNM